jgi:hypothetical protein
VFVGCGAAVRRCAFIEAGGFDRSFEYYAEEYDLCAKLLLNGWRIVHDQRFRVRHEKVAAGRDMSRILRFLVRNNCWVMQRYAPLDERHQAVAEIITRYARIAMKERAACGFAHGVSELATSMANEPRRPMPQALFDRFTGLAQARATLGHDHRLAPGTRIAIVDEGKNAWAVRRALDEAEVEVVSRIAHADVLVIGTLSPGPMHDALARWKMAEKPVLAPVSSHLEVASVADRTRSRNNSRTCPIHAPIKLRAKLPG